jgi:hypothetical protein
MLGQTAGLSAGVDLALSLIEKDIRCPPGEQVAGHPSSPSW